MYVLTLFCFRDEISDWKCKNKKYWRKRLRGASDGEERKTVSKEKFDSIKRVISPFENPIRCLEKKFLKGGNCLTSASVSSWLFSFSR